MGTYLLYVLVGCAAGFSSALLGIGGGVIMVPVLILLFRLDPKAATATSLGYIAPVALYGVLKQWHGGADVRWWLVALAVPAGIVGAELGIRAKQVISNAHLQLLFALLMVVVGVRLGWRGWQSLHASPPAAAVQSDGPADQPPAPR